MALRLKRENSARYRDNRLYTREPGRASQPDARPLFGLVNSSEPSSSAGTGRADAIAAHSALRLRFEAEELALEKQSTRFSAARLITFLLAISLIAAGISGGKSALWIAGIAVSIAFLGAVIAQRRVVAKMDGARTRKQIHERHLRRMRGDLEGLPDGKGLIGEGHAYASDIDVIGPGSLFQRIDVTHTVHGAQTLAGWLAAPSKPEQIRARQLAVQELARNVELRQELEASALLVGDDLRLDGRPFRAFAELPSYLAKQRAIDILSYVLPLVTLALYTAGQLERVHGALWLLPVAGHIALISQVSKFAHRAFDLASARQGTVDAFERMLRVVETAKLEGPLLREIQARVCTEGTKPSEHLARLRAWTSSSELRKQGLLYIFVNPLTLWDVHVLRGLERWNRDVGRQTTDWFVALGELEALSSLATLAFGDPDATMPVIADAPFEARGLCHPLLAANKRVANDIALAGRGSAMLITGSNMAGKSTLLRAVGQNVVLALAGGPVCAASMTLPIVRLRASMRVDDSLQRGASYFHAELGKLRSVIDGADEEPPVMFLLDELLRGTNAQARHIGARAVLVHLLDRGAFGLVATHDIALWTLEEERKGKVINQHFTDVVINGEMLFDYTLRPGVVRTSNALRLLTLAGIDVPGESLQLMPQLEVQTAERALREENR
jgi:hypothetical protein